MVPESVVGICVFVVIQFHPAVRQCRSSNPTGKYHTHLRSTERRRPTAVRLCVEDFPRISVVVLTAPFRFAMTATPRWSGDRVEKLCQVAERT